MDLIQGKMLENKKIAVFGGAILDVYIDVYIDFKRPEKAKSPETGNPLYIFKSSERLLGGAANVANNVKALGCEPYLVSVVGDDYSGKKFLDVMRKNNIGIENIFLSENSTTSKVRYLNRSSISNVLKEIELLRVDNDPRIEISRDLEEKIKVCLREVLERSDALIVSDNLTGIERRELVEYAILCANRNKIPVLLDPKEKLYKGITLIKPNLKEMSYLANMRITSNDSLKYAAKELKRLTSANYVVVTLGKGGVALFYDDKERYFSSSENAIDVTGAGDTMISVLACCLANDYDIEKACCLANLAASIAVKKEKTAVITREELEKLNKL